MAQVPSTPWNRTRKYSSSNYLATHKLNTLPLNKKMDERYHYSSARRETQNHEVCRCICRRHNPMGQPGTKYNRVTTSHGKRITKISRNAGMDRGGTNAHKCFFSILEWEFHPNGIPKLRDQKYTLQINRTQ